MNIMDIIAALLALIALVNGSGEETSAYEVFEDPVTPVVVQVEPEPVIVETEPCRGTVVEIVWMDTEYGPNPLQGGRVNTGIEVGEIRTDVVGDFLWVQFDHIDNPDSQADDIVSFFIEPGTTEIEVCKP